nr:hypothetical protein CFP56_76966 [Quercus suber]
MPLSIRLPPDKIIWGLTPSGMFTTKSAYKLLVSRNSTNHAGTSSFENQRLFWRSLWQLRVLNKLKHFAWRASSDALPTMTSLVWRHIATIEPPDENKFKVNFDAAVFKSCNQAGIGVIVRDWRGEAIRALSTSVPAAQSVVELEALACRQAVRFAVELGLQDVIFEGDSL